MGFTCRFLGCHTNTKSYKKLFRFPSDEKRCKVWVEKSKNPALAGKTAAWLNKNARLCEDHFKEWCFMNLFNKSNLVYNAVPSTEKHNLCVTDNYSHIVDIEEIESMIPSSIDASKTEAISPNKVDISETESVSPRSVDIDKTEIIPSTSVDFSTTKSLLHTSLTSKSTFQCERKKITPGHAKVVKEIKQEKDSQKFYYMHKVPLSELYDFEISFTN